MYETLYYAIGLVLVYCFIGVAMNKGSAITAEIFALSWEDILVILGAVLSVVQQIAPLIPGFPAWLPVVIAIVVKVIKDLSANVTVSINKAARGR